MNNKPTKPRYQHAFNLTEEQEAQFKEVREKGKSIVDIVMLGIESAKDFR